MISFETAYTWLNRFKDRRTYLSQPCCLLLLQINEALKEGDVKGVNVKIDELIKTGDRAKDDHEIAEIRLECARVYYELGHLDLAERFLTRAVSRYASDRHNQAVALWMRGVVRWRQRNMQAPAVEDWRNSQSLFVSLSRSFLGRVEDGKWYQERAEKMQAALQAAIENGGLPDRTTLNMLPVLDHTLGPSRWTERFASVDQVLIDRSLYRLVSLGRTRVFNIFDVVPPNRYLILKVSPGLVAEDGFFRDGEYVLLHEHAVPQHNDFVVVRFIDGDILCLMRYLDQGDYVGFLEENQGLHKPELFRRDSNRYEIWGVVEGVFRPLHPQWDG